MNYYKKEYVKHLIRESSKDREISFLGKGNVRGLKIKNNFDFERILKYVNWETKRQNLYRSVAKLKNIPEFTFNPKKRSDETRGFFEKDYAKGVYEYDLFLDIDKEEDSAFEEVLKEVKELLDYFNEYSIPYYVLFSGKKGFQIIIDGKYLPKPKLEDGFIQPHKKIAENVKNAFNLKFLDLRNNGVPSRLCKIPYSIVGKNIALPLNDFQIENFNLDRIKKEYVESSIKLIRRGHLERFQELTEKDKIKNVGNLIKSIDFK